MFNENGLSVEFFDEALEQKAESRKKGRPVYKDVTLVRIQLPADQNTIIVRAATKDDMKTYRKAYQAYENEAKAAKVDGMPLKEWPGVTRSEAREAAYYKVVTVEQLANAEDDVMNELGADWPGLRDKARSYLMGSEDHAQSLALAEENAELKKQVEAMQNALQQQAKKDDQEHKRGPGRPPKTDSDKE